MTDETKNSGGPAFPQNEFSFMSGDGREGMTLRDWFAGQNAAAMLGAITALQVDVAEGEAKAFAKAAYILADAMIVERSK